MAMLEEMHIEGEKKREKLLRTAQPDHIPGGRS
jgi:hypothetical protein